jgi:hypothetical protein
MSNERDFEDRCELYGSVIVRSTGGMFETFGRIADPNEFRRQVPLSETDPARRLSLPRPNDKVRETGLHTKVVTAPFQL